MEAYLHTPVLLNEVLTWLDPRPGETVVDATIGTGGHAERILQAIAPDGRLFGFDLDAQALTTAKARLDPFHGRVVLKRASYLAAPEALLAEGVTQVDRILLDLGVSSLELSESGRGFSFQHATEPLDMRFNPEAVVPTAADLLKSMSKEQIQTLLSEYGEEPLAHQIAAAIVAQRQTQPIERVGDLLPVILRAYGRRWSTRSKRHPATRTFQALRIAVNDELATLEKALPALFALLRPNGRIAVITFHSLEDRTVKHFFKENSRGCVCPPELPECRCTHKATLNILTKHVTVPTAEEQTHNPRSRSAKLRVAERISTT